MSRQLLGPQAFPLERMLAIFYSIIDDSVDATSDIYMQISNLISHNLLTKVGGSDTLDNIKCKCAIGYTAILGISKSVRFDINKYLHDFS